jgi:hypothetical protein
VYPWQASDGLCGGSPHMHLTCTEGYVTAGGRGAVQTLTAEGFTETPLVAGTVAWFSPGTIHRAVNHDDLKVVVVMQNSGLPEAGDAVFTFPPDVLADPAAYRRAATLTEPLADAALARRDLAVAGFLRLRDGGSLTDFYTAAVALVADRLDDWERIWTDGPVAAAERTGEHLKALRDGRIDHLLEAGVRSEHAPAEQDRKFGMCGRLETYRLGPKGAV